MSIEMNKLSVVKKKRLEKSQFNVECNVDANAEVEKILSVCETAQVESCEVLNGEINYAGLIDLCVIFTTPEGEIGTVQCFCPFTSKFEDEHIKAGEHAKISVCVVEYEIDSVANGNIKIDCKCEQSAVLTYASEVDTASPTDEDMCIKEDEIVLSTLIGHSKEVFEVKSETTIKEPIKKLVYSNAQVYIKSVESGVNFVSTNGEVITKIVYLSASDRFETCYLSEGFKEEIELEGVNRDSVSEADAHIKKNAVKVEVDETDKGVKISFILPVSIEVVAYEEKTEKIVKDLYSTKNELQISTSSFEMTKQLCSDYFETKIDGTLTLDSDKPRVDKLLFASASSLQITNAYIKNGEVFVEGITKTNVVYLNDESSALHSVLMEVPFVVSDKTSAEETETKVDVSAVLSDVDVVVKKGREFLFDAKLKICARYDCDKVDATISNVEKVAKYPEKEHAIELYFGSAGQSAWDIAKQMKIAEREICMQNPDVSFPLQKDENIVIFYQKKP